MNRSLRNILIFALVTVSIGWIGAWINTQIESPSPQQSLGLLIWIFVPMLTGFLLRGFGGDGWADFGFRFNFRGNGSWYALSILLYPLGILITLGLGVVLGFVSFGRSLADLPGIFIVGLLGALIKNIGEEYAWRGYLTPRFKALGVSDLKNHILTALIWGAWHIPYWIFFLGSAIIDQYSNLGMMWFIVIGIIGIFPTALVLGELRLKTGSVLPAYLAHNITNALSAQLILEGFVKFKPGAQLIFSPNVDGLVMLALFWGIGLWMMKRGAVKG
jgi:membrane protease YdiL (CAAX protease family)